MKLTNEELYRLYLNETNEVVKHELREEFFRNNERLPLYFAHKYANLTNDLNELVSAANFGMLKAFNTYKLDSGIKFVTYASRVMINEILMFDRRNKRHKDNLSMEYSVSTSSEGKELTVIDLLHSDDTMEDDLGDADLVAKIKEVAPKIFSGKEYVVWLNMMSDTPLNQQGLAKQIGVSQSYASRLQTKIIEKIKKLVLSWEVEL